MFRSPFEALSSILEATSALFPVSYSAKPAHTSFNIVRSRSVTSELNMRASHAGITNAFFDRDLEPTLIAAGEIEQIGEKNDCHRFMSVPGIGALISTPRLARFIDHMLKSATARCIDQYTTVGDASIACQSRAINFVRRPDPALLLLPARDSRQVKS
jgi:hypothetical protein